jgi:hypothetical protein
MCQNSSINQGWFVGLGRMEDGGKTLHFPHCVFFFDKCYPREHEKKKHLEHWGGKACK